MSNRHPHSTGRLRRLKLRQRKKLHVGEFREQGFELRLGFAQALNAEDYMPIWNALHDMAHARDLLLVGLGGSFPMRETDAFVCMRGPGSVSEADRAALQAWLATQPGIARAELGELMDAWHEA